MPISSMILRRIKMKNAEVRMKNFGIAFGEVLKEGALNGYTY